jgi:hypothetical protein
MNADRGEFLPIRENLPYVIIINMTKQRFAFQIDILVEFSLCQYRIK